MLRDRGVNTDDIEHVSRRQDVLLARPLRLRPQHRAHRRHAAERVRRLRAEAVGGIAGLPRRSSSPTSSRTCSARCGRSAPAPTLAGLDSMNLWIETARDSLASAIARRRPRADERRRAAHADRGAEPRARRARGDGDGTAHGGRQAGRVRRRAVHRRTASSRCPATRSRTVRRPDRRGRQLRRRLPRLPRRALGDGARRPDAAARDDLRLGDGVLQRRGVRHRARAAPDARRDQPALRGVPAR